MQTATTQKLRPLAPRRSAESAAFTLVELMVSISVLAILGGLVAQLMGSASRLTSNSKQTSDGDSEARYAFNQIASDLGRRINRKDVDAYLAKPTGNDLLYFFTQTPGYSPTLTDAKNRSPVSLVGYRVYERKTETNSVWELQRYSRSLAWARTDKDPELPYVILTGSPAAPVPSTTLAGTDGRGTGGSFPGVIAQQDSEDSFYQVIAQNVIRFEVSLLRKPDLTDPKSPIPARVLSDAEIAAEFSRNGFTNISAVVVTIALLDSQNMARTSSAVVSSLNLADTEAVQGAIRYPLDDWNRQFLSQIKALPKSMGNGVRLYQRVIAL
jgi:prepilin-type N-terminal cleavage/methylation domain-containing protein